MERRRARSNWLLYTALTWTGLLISMAGIGIGIWEQVATDFPRSDTTVRLEFALTALTVVGIGVVIIAAARIMAVLVESQRHTASS